jgi:hypothetical protein
LPWEHPGYADGLGGTARPRGGHSDPARHNGGDTESIFTSWTDNYQDVAHPISQEGNGPGIVLRVPNADGAGYRRVQSPDIYGEDETLIQGDVTGAEVSINGGPWAAAG